MKRVSLVLFSLAVAGVMPTAASASAKMFPTQFASETTGPAMPTRLVRCDAVVRNGLAIVRNEYRFENTSYDQIEGLLRTRVPRTAVVTDFAYYFKGVRVAGRVLENEEAQQIYRAITGAGRDPALLRRRDDGTYEARVFPVEPRSEIRVELEYRYAVPETAAGLKFTYPLTAGNTGRPIDQVQVRVRFEGDPLEGVTAAPGTAAEGAAAFEAQKLQPVRDFVAVARLGRGTPRSQVIREARSGEDGFFAVRARGDGKKPLSPPQGLLKRLGAHHFFPARLADGSHTRYWFGRCAGTGSEESSLSGVSTAAAEANELPTFWAQAYTDTLAAYYRARHLRQTRNLVVELSKRYRIDTAFTSYLAVPESEWAAYENRLDQVRREPVEQLRWNAESLRIVAQLPPIATPGDPVIRVKHQPDLVRVVAVLPDGDILPLRLDPALGVWEARFDIPEGAAEGEYPVTVVLTETGGKRSEVRLTYHVDLTAPAGKLLATAENGRLLRLETGADVVRAAAFLPDGTRVDLQRDAVPGVWRGELGLPPGRHTVRVRLYDHVHNWVELEEKVDVR